MLAKFFARSVAHSYSSFNRDPDFTLDIFTREKLTDGNLVDLKPLTFYLSDEVTLEFREIIFLVNGKEIQDLSPKEDELIQLVIELGNKGLVKNIFRGQWKNALWSEALRVLMKEHIERFATYSQAELRMQERENKYELDCRMNELFTTIKTQEGF